MDATHLKAAVPALFRLVLLVTLLPITAQVARSPTQQSVAIPPADQASLEPRVEQALGQLPLYFVENQGQMDEQVAYYVQGRDTSVYFTSEGVTFALMAPFTPTLTSGQEPMPEHLSRPPGHGAPDALQRWVVKLDFVGASEGVRPAGEEPAEAVVSYFKGQPDEWHAGLPTYTSIVYRDLWPGIDLVYHGAADRLKYEFVVHPGADPAQIQLAYRGATGLEINGDGQMVVKTPPKDLVDDAPVAYQEIGSERVDVGVAYTVLPAVAESYPYTFSVGGYDSAMPLIVDPAVLLYCGYIGGSGEDYGRGITVDAMGNAYVTGLARAVETTFPVAVGPDLTHSGGSDAFVAKVKADGTALDYCGYIGGAGDDLAYAIAVDCAGNAYVAGQTESSESTFPVATGPDLAYNGGEYDGFVAKVKADGTALDYCGYIGGSGWDSGFDIAVDGSGNAYVTGHADFDETTFPVAVGPDLTHNGGQDAFVAKVKADGTALDYCGYIGGSGNDYGDSIALDGTGSAYVTGETDSSETTFPVAVGPDLTHNGEDDAFVAKVNAAGTALDYCGYIGGSDSDVGKGIAVDRTGNAYVAGRTESAESTFPVTNGPDLTYNDISYYDAFVAKVKADGTALDYCGYVGGSEYDGAWDIAIDGSGSAYVTGQTNSAESTFPVTIGPDLTFNGGSDAFVAKVKADGIDLDYCGYIGGSDGDYGYAVVEDGAGNVYVAGHTQSTEATFPVYAGPDLSQNDDGDYRDAFVAKAIVDDVPPISSASSPASTEEFSFTVSWTGSDDTSGVDSYDIQYRVGHGGTWQDWLLNTSLTSAVFGPASPVATKDDHTYYFRVRARDRAGNIGEFAPDGDCSTLVGSFHVYLPLTLRDYVSLFKGPWEQEDNDNYLQANGPLRSGQDYYGYPDDQKDYFSIYLPASGTLAASVDGHTGQGVQLFLFYQSPANEVGWDYEAPYDISYTGPAGWYYVYIYTESGFNATTSYTLRVTYL
jgi:hypothetical protein